MHNCLRRQMDVHRQKSCDVDFGKLFVVSKLDAHWSWRLAKSRVVRFFDDAIRRALTDFYDADNTAVSVSATRVQG